jgi:hypothetical protein
METYKIDTLKMIFSGLQATEIPDVLILLSETFTSDSKIQKDLLSTAKKIQSKMEAKNEK